jgi:short-subunit dehydrogenase
MFKDQVVWITGASSGIGEALAVEFAKQGARLVLSARREDALEKVKAQCDAVSDEAALVMPFDIADSDAIEQVAKEVQANVGRVDVLINNAGISQRSSCLDTQMSTYRKLFEIDVFGQIALTKAVLPMMIEQGSGHVAVTSSVAGKIGAPLRTGYCAAKHAVMGFFDALRTEVDHLGIKVTTITPGYIRTNISANAVGGDGTEFGKTDDNIRNGMDVEDCAKMIMRGFERGKPEIAVGVGMEMHALWIKRFFPKLLFKITAGQYEKQVKHDNLS